MDVYKTLVSGVCHGMAPNSDVGCVADLTIRQTKVCGILLRAWVYDWKVWDDAASRPTILGSRDRSSELLNAADTSSLLQQSDLTKRVFMDT